MNYMETVLQKSAALWKQQEEALQSRMRLLMGEKSAQETQDTAEDADGRKNAAQKRNAAAGENAAAQESVPESVIPSALFAPVMQAAQNLTARSSAQWMRDALKEGATQGLSADSARTVLFEEQERSGAEMLRFSRSLERDARRYDGNFLLY